MKKRNRILISAGVGAILVFGLFVLLNRHRALVRQPSLFLKCMLTNDIQTSRWSHMLSTVDYFWWANRVHIGPYGEWHALPIFRSNNMTNEVADVVSKDDIRVMVEMPEEAQQENP